MVEVMFESLGSSSLFIAHQSVLSTYTHSGTSGLVVDAGYAVSHAMPVHEGYGLAHDTKRMDLVASCLS